METDLFPEATTLEGIDIDEYALRKGKAYLSAHMSKIRSIHADMKDLDHIMDGRIYDLILYAEVLMYLNSHSASDVVQTILDHRVGLVAIVGLAHPFIDNALLRYSEPRIFDGAMIHNIDAMVEKADGHVVFRKWEDSNVFDGQAVYFVFCRPRTAGPEASS